VDRREILHRFRLLVIAYTVIGVTMVAGIAIDYNQTQQIKDTQVTTCDIVTATASVFVDFIKKEIALRSVREARPNVPGYVEIFDEAEIAYWKEHTLPMLKNVLRYHCKG
jgi:hypothetical protein